MTEPPTVSLPDQPRRLWNEIDGRWYVTLVGLLLLADFAREREVSVSSNGLSLRSSERPRSRFIPWAEIAEIVEAPDPDLAIIELRDHTSVTLDRWHVHNQGERRRLEKTRRLHLLKSALLTSREISPGSTSESRKYD